MSERNVSSCNKWYGCWRLWCLPGRLLLPDCWPHDPYYMSTWNVLSRRIYKRIRLSIRYIQRCFRNKGIKTMQKLSCKLLLPYIRYGSCRSNFDLRSRLRLLWRCIETRTYWYDYRRHLPVWCVLYSHRRSHLLRSWFYRSLLGSLWHFSLSGLRERLLLFRWCLWC